MGDERILQAMRGQAWERAKGELRAIGQAGFSGARYNPNETSPLSKFYDATDAFIEKVESEGWLE